MGWGGGSSSRGENLRAGCPRLVASPERKQALQCAKEVGPYHLSEMFHDLEKMMFLHEKIGFVLQTAICRHIISIQIIFVRTSLIPLAKALSRRALWSRNEGGLQESS
jgi:hypothetical protein